MFLNKGLVILLFCVLALPAMYGIGTVYAITRLQWSFPHLNAYRDGWDIYVSLTIDVRNPTVIPIPSFSYAAEIKLNDHILLDTSSDLGSLNPRGETTISLTATVNVDIFSDLFWTLVDFLKGEAVTLYARFKLYLHLLVDVTIYEKIMEGTVELY